MSGDIQASRSETLVRPRWPMLDGLRGVAVVMVVAYHLAVPPFRNGGFLGVEIFFVLSGFLITALIVGEWTMTADLSLRAFFGRRIVRLYPAQLALVVTVFTIALLFASGHTRRELLAGVPSSLLYFGNWVKAFGWWGQGALTHTWSLAIEEQYYVVWPLLGLLALRRSGARGLLVLASAMTVVFVILRVVLYLDGATLVRLYNGTDTRAPALLLGSLVGALLVGTRWRPRIPSVTLGAAFAVLVALAVGLSVSRAILTFWLIGADLLIAFVIVGAALGSDESLIGRLLTSKPATYLGRLSYSLYLWHKAVIVILGPRLHHLGRPLSTAILVVAFSALAVASSKLIEHPSQRFRRRFERPCGVPASASPESKSVVRT